MAFTLDSPRSAVIGQIRERRISRCASMPAERRANRSVGTVLVAAFTASMNHVWSVGRPRSTAPLLPCARGDPTAPRKVGVAHCARPTGGPDRAQRIRSRRVRVQADHAQAAAGPSRGSGRRRSQRSFVHASAHLVSAGARRRESTARHHGFRWLGARTPYLRPSPWLIVCSSSDARRSRTGVGIRVRHDQEGGGDDCDQITLCSALTTELLPQNAAMLSRALSGRPRWQ